MAFGLALALLAGCHSSQPYGQPSYYGQPVYQPPAGSYIAPGGAIPGPALQVAPTGGAYLPNNPHAGTIGRAPTFNPATDVQSIPRSQPGARDNLVPEYNDPGDFAPPKSGSSKGSSGFEGDAAFDDFSTPRGSSSGAKSPPKFDDDAFQEMSSQRPDYGAAARVQLQGIEPLVEPYPTRSRSIDTFSTELLPAGTAAVRSSSTVEPWPADAEGFEPPIQRPTTTSVPSTGAAVSTGLQETSVRTSGPNPYAHDRESFRWLRGMIDFDERTGSWNVIYSLRPEEGDEFGGSLELLARPADLEGLQSGDVVLVEGRVDRSSLDPLGKPRYRVEQIAPLVPSN